MAPGDPTPVGTPGVGTGGSSKADVYVRDHLLNVTATVSIGSPRGALRPAISANGRHVLYYSAYDALAAGASRSSIEDLYVRDLGANTTALVTLSTSGSGGANGPSFGGYASADGRYVTFTSKASNLVAGDTNNEFDVFVRDRDPDGDGVFDEANATTTLLSPGFATGISADGRYVTFDRIDSSVSDKSQTFVLDRKGTADTGDDTTVLVSRASDGAPANDHAGTSSISGDGRFVAFQSDASNLVEGVTAPGMIFVRDLKAETTTLVSRSSAGAPVSANSPSISGDGASCPSPPTPAPSSSQTPTSCETCSCVTCRSKRRRS
jgi:Tol biopolymer transport system component